MSDNFDLPWLDNDDDKPDESANRPSGVTGQLPWRQLPTDSPDSGGESDNLQVDWGQSSQQSTNRQADPTKGLTGMLPWNAAASDPEDQPPDEMVAWLDEDDRQQTPEEPAFEDDPEPFEMGAFDTSPASEPQEAWVSDLRQEIQSSAEELPDWMTDFADEPAEEFISEAETPDWMNAFDEPESAPASSEPDWMSGFAEPEAPMASEETPDWMNAFDEPETASASSEPDWMSGFAEPEAPMASEETPDWMNVFDEPEAAPASSEPDWMSGFADPTSDSEDDLVPDWLIGAEDELDAEADDNSLDWMTEESASSESDWMTSDGSEFATGIYNQEDLQSPEPQSYEEWARLNQGDQADEYVEDDLNWLSEEPAPDLTYQDWELQQSEVERQQLDPEIPLPDFEMPEMTDTGSLSADYVPEWFMGVEELDDADAPDWARASLGKPVTAPIEEPPADDIDLLPFELDDILLPTTGDLEFLPDLDLPPLVEETGGIRRLGSAQGGSDALDLGDLLAEEEDDLDAPQLEDIFPSSAPSFDDLFGDSGAIEDEEDASAPAWLQEYTPEEEEAEEPLPLMMDESDYAISDPSALPDWLSDIEAAPLPIESDELEDDLEFSAIADLEPAEATDSFDLDSILGSVPTLSDETNMESAPTDVMANMDDIGFDDAFLSDFRQTAEPMEMPLDDLAEEEDEAILFESEELPEWMRQVQTTGDEVPLRLAGVEGYFEQVPEVVLSPELRELREITQTYSPSSVRGETPKDGTALAGIVGGLGVVENFLRVGRLSATRVYEPSPEQQTRLTAFQQVLEKVQDEEALDKDNAIRYNLDHEDEEAALEDLTAPPTAKRRVVKLQRDRIVISVIALLVLILPFVLEPMQFADAPGTELSADAQPLVLTIDSLAASSSEKRVLVAFEYGPTAAQELDPLAEAVLRDLFAQDAEVVVVSTNLMGLLHSQSVLGELAADEALLASIAPIQPRYTVLRYLAGGAVGVRSLLTSETTSSLLFARDINGDETDLDIGRVDSEDFAFVLVIGEGFEDVRTWAEQLDRLAVPKFLLVSAAAEPFARPYLNAGSYQGMVSGLTGAMSYDQTRNQGRIAEVDTNGLPETRLSQWHSVIWGILLAALLILVGWLLAIIRALRGRRRA